MSESSETNQWPSRPVYEWIIAGTLVITSLAAVAALFFTRQSIEATNSQLRISEQGQITDRYNAAIANLGSRSIDIRLGGIYALQRLMQDSPRDQPTIVAVLCAFVRDRTTSTRKPRKPPAAQPPTDIQAALTVVGTRNTANDGRATVVDLDRAQLARDQFVRHNLAHAHLTGANLTGANLNGADLTGAHLQGAHLAGADLQSARLTGANLNGADLTGANLNSAVLTAANLTRAHLSGADLFNARLWQAVLIKTDFTGADLTYANFGRLILQDPDFTGANLKGASWPAGVAVPKGWLRDAHSGRLKRSST